MTDEQHTRMQCLELASVACGSDISFEYVLNAARKYVEFVMVKRPELNIVASNEDKPA